MRITRASYERLDLKLSEPYTIAYETVSQTSNFILRLETDGKLMGFGCAAPDPVVTGETPEQVETVIKEIIIPYLKGKNPFTYALILSELRLLLKDRSSALAMVDLALHDLIAKKADVPLYRFLGGYRNSIPTSVTIGILPLKETLEKARKLIEQGFTILKIKGGSLVDEDIEKMLKLRETFREITLRFDGNQGYSVDEAVIFVDKTRSAGI